jgi:hypothetical protein
VPNSVAFVLAVLYTRKGHGRFYATLLKALGGVRRVVVDTAPWPADRAYDSDPLDEELRRDGIEMIAHTARIEASCLRKIDAV